MRGVRARDREEERAIRVRPGRELAGDDDGLPDLEPEEREAQQERDAEPTTRARWRPRLIPDSAAYTSRLLEISRTVITIARSSLGSAMPSGGQPSEVLKRT